MQRIAQIYNGYVMVIGMTSYLNVGGKFKQTRITQAYALVINAVTLTLLPGALWESARTMTMVDWVPSFVWTIPYVVHSISYAVIAYTLISRCYRDAMLLDLELVIKQLNREMLRTGKQMNSKLQRLFLLKTFTLTYLCFAYMMSIFVWRWGHSWAYIMKALLINMSFNILIASTYFYFVSLWQIARGYDFVNQQLQEITSANWNDFKEQAEELRSLWALHANLSRTAERINRHYGPQMLASRFDHFIFSIINGYLGTVNARYDDCSSVENVFGFFLYCIRSLDFFLNDYICDLMTQYQSEVKTYITEGQMSKELSSYVIYEHSMRLNLLVCGLYPANRNKWMHMIASIIIHSSLLLQFHLIMTKK
ncbi:putative gustatory receptor 59b [Drosophila serrata]|uniref:putative gustatory receptor 59b n=1 Tax=Drosophila serrata TaxID=7274 RepID=UPI000A1D0572|nr:putative gustatory receptor 59b [Drosophila serrata]